MTWHGPPLAEGEPFRVHNHPRCECEMPPPCTVCGSRMRSFGCHSDEHDDLGIKRRAAWQRHMRETVWSDPHD